MASKIPALTPNKMIRHAYIYMFTAIAYILIQFEMEPAENPPDMLDWKDQTGAVPVAPPLVWLRPRNQT